MKIKHSKFKNTGLIYELLVRQITSDLVDRKESPAVSIFRRYFADSNSLILREFRLYETVLKSVGITTIKADNLITAAIDSSRTLNLKELKQAKYNLISEIKESYDLDEFFGVSVPQYKPLAAFYCLLEADRVIRLGSDLVDPQSVVTNRVTLMEHMTNRYQPEDKVKDSILEEYSNYDKDLKLIVFKILLEKFNEKYKHLLPEQKELLKRVISTGSTKNLVKYLTAELVTVKEQLEEQSKFVQRGIERIKLQEVIKMIDPEAVKVSDLDEHLVRTLQYYSLLAELKKSTNV